MKPINLKSLNILAKRPESLEGDQIGRTLFLQFSICKRGQESLVRHVYVAAIIAAVVAAPALAADADSHAAHHPQATAAPAAAPIPEKETAQAGMTDNCPIIQGSGGTKPMDCTSVLKAQPDSKSKDH